MVNIFISLEIFFPLCTESYQLWNPQSCTTDMPENSFTTICPTLQGTSDIWLVATAHSCTRQNTLQDGKKENKLTTMLKKNPVRLQEEFLPTTGSHIKRDKLAAGLYSSIQHVASISLKEGKSLSAPFCPLAQRPRLSSQKAAPVHGDRFLPGCYRLALRPHQSPHHPPWLSRPTHPHTLCRGRRPQLITIFIRKNPSL